MNSVAIYMALVLTQVHVPVHFDTEIIPSLTRAGCNSGACHGAAAGRGDFHLSLLGANPEADYEAIIREFEGRRVNLAAPERSLIFTKPTGHLDHGGEVLFDEDSAIAARILAWLRAGAPREGHRRLTNLTLEADPARCDQLPATVAIKVLARFDDGPEQDVTEFALLTPTDPASIHIDDQHRAHVVRRGQHVVIARFLDRVVPLQIHAPMSDLSVDHSQQPSSGFIDDHVLHLLTELRLPVSAPATEAAWLRRVTLDLTGRLPEPLHVETYLADPSKDKRSRKVNELLETDAFADYWTLHFGKLLRIHSLPNESEGMQVYSKWLRQQIADGTPFDEVAKQLLVATGDSHRVGPANFGRMVPDARAHAELVGQVFLGMRLGCANCHNHPLDRWTQDDYHGLAAIFAPLDRSRQVAFTARGAVTNLRTGEPAVPRVPSLRNYEEPGDHRAAVVDWVTSSDKLYFARATVNRLWKAMFGRGLVEPTDDLRETNPATHPRLLTQLAEDFSLNGYSIRSTLKQIALSHVYARSSEVVATDDMSNELDDRFYSRAYQRPLEPEVLIDAIADVTGVPLELAGSNIERAVSIIDPLAPAKSLDILGRCNRVTDCDESRRDGVDLPAQLHLLNGDLINQRIASDKGRLRKLIDAGRSNQAIVQELYLRALCRPASIDELQRWQTRLDVAEPIERTRRLEDFFWSLLNSRQFRENF